MSAHETYNLRIGDRDEDEHHHVYLTISDWKNSFNADCSEYFEMSGICKPERAQAIVTAVNSYSALQARVAELEKENKSLCIDKQDLIDALQPLLGCADYAREQDLSGHEPLVVTAGEAYDANSIHERVLSRAALQGGSNG